MHRIRSLPSHPIVNGQLLWSRHSVVDATESTTNPPVSDVKRFTHPEGSSSMLSVTESLSTSFETVTLSSSESPQNAVYILLPSPPALPNHILVSSPPNADIHLLKVRAS